MKTEKHKPNRHPKERENFRKYLKELLIHTEIKDGFVDTESDSSWGLDFAQKAMEYSKPYITKDQAWRFILRKVVHSFDTQKNGKLEFLTDVDKLSNEIFAFFESLPRDYSVYLKLSPGKNEFEDMVLSENISILGVDRNLCLLNIFSVQSKFTKLSAMVGGPTKEPVFASGQSVLKISVRGYGDSDPSSLAIISALTSIKTILYLGKSAAVFENEGSWVTWTGGYKKRLFLVDETNEPTVAVEVNAPGETIEHICSYIVSDNEEFKIRGQHYTRHQYYLGRIAELLDSPSEDVNRIPIVTAAEWAFESSSSRNETVSFIQLCIALESVLGDDRERVGLSRMLGDRCAYLLGNTSEQRSSIRENFEVLYRHRSKLVHGRKVRLEDDAHESLKWGRKVLSKILRRELMNFSDWKLREN